MLWRKLSSGGICRYSVCRKGPAGAPTAGTPRSSCRDRQGRQQAERGRLSDALQEEKAAAGFALFQADAEVTVRMFYGKVPPALGQKMRPDQEVAPSRQLETSPKNQLGGLS
jgi:hypothetical protein